jgi:hypothetical protein
MFEWIIYFVLGHLPIWIWPMLAGIAAAFYFISGMTSYFPMLLPYSIFVRPVAFAVFCFAIFTYGGAGVENINKAEIQRLEQKAAIAAQASKDENLLLLTKLENTQVQIITQKNISAKSILDKKKKLDAECKLNIDAIRLYNSVMISNQTMETKK